MVAWGGGGGVERKKLGNPGCCSYLPPESLLSISFPTSSRSLFAPASIPRFSLTRRSR